jgi:hypothetical protein
LQLNQVSHKVTIGSKEEELVLDDEQTG